MARPPKEGLNYYNVDTDRYQDKKIKQLKKNFKAVGVAVYDYILNQIYRDKGCFIVWDESTVFDVAEYYDLKETLVQEIVTYCGVVGLFSKEVLTSEKILTSASIQERYMNICVLSRRKKIIIPESIRLMREETVVNVGVNEVNSYESTQSKVKESKEKESKVITTTLFEEGEITEAPSMVLKRLFPKLLIDKAKNGGLGPEEIDTELINYDNHHLKQQTAFTDTKHILNSWGKWCENYFKNKQEKFIKGNGQQQLVATAKKPTDKTKSDWT
jgi:hypothetical protein